MSLREETIAFDLAKYFLLFYKKYTTKTFKLSSVKTTKWWNFFLKTAQEYSTLEDFDAYVWVASQFDKHGKILPYMIYGEGALKTFNEYKERFNINSTKQLAENLLLTYNVIKKWSKQNGFETINFSEYLNNKKNILFLERKNVNPILLTVVKSFIEMDRNIRDKILSEEEISIKRSLIFSNKKIKNKLTEILKNEFI